MTLSFILPAWKVRFLQEAIASIVAQTSPDHRQRRVLQHVRIADDHVRAGGIDRNLEPAADYRGGGRGITVH